MLLWVVATVAFVVGAAYVIGGRAFFRRVLTVRSRAVATIQATLQPPSQAAIAAAGAADTAGPPLQHSEHVSVVFMACTIAGVLVTVLALFYLTGRRR